MKTLTNVKMLEQKIEESGLRPVALAAAWGVSLPTYYNLKAGKSEFTASVIVRAAASLRMTKVERDLIFLGESVSENHEINC